MKRIHENTQLVDSTSVVCEVTVYTMKSLGVGGVVGLGEGFFCPSLSDFVSFSCRNMRIYVPVGHFDPPPVSVGLKILCRDRNVKVIFLAQRRRFVSCELRSLRVVSRRHLQSRPVFIMSALTVRGV